MHTLDSSNIFIDYIKILAVNPLSGAGGRRVGYNGRGMDKGRSGPIAAGCVMLLFGAGMAAGYGLQELTLRSAMFVALACSAMGIFLLSYERAMQLFFVYLGIEGFAKIMTGYNPVVHIGADLLVAALTARFVLSGILRGRLLTRRLPPLTALFVLHACWFLIATANPFALSLVASLAAAKMYITMPLLFFFGYYLSTSQRRIDGFIIPWLVVCLLQSSTSLYQAALGPRSVLGLHPLYAVQLNRFKGYAFRPFGLTSQPGGPAIYVYLVSPLLLYLFVRSRSTLLRLSLLILLGGSTLTLILCQVRSALLKGMVGLGAFLGTHYRAMARESRSSRRAVLGFVVIAGLLLAVAIPTLIRQMSQGSADTQMAVERSMTLFDLSKSGSARSGAMERFLAYAAQAPLGAGLSRTGAAAGKFGEQIEANPFFRQGFFSDNFWVATVVDLGIPGTVLLTVLVLSILFLGARNCLRIQDPGLRVVNGALLCGLASVVLGFYGAEAILYNPEAAFFWFFSGAMLRIPELDAELATQGPFPASSLRRASTPGL